MAKDPNFNVYTFEEKHDTNSLRLAEKIVKLPAMKAAEARVAFVHEDCRLNDLSAKIVQPTGNLLGWLTAVRMPDYSTMIATIMGVPNDNRFLEAAAQFASANGWRELQPTLTTTPATVTA